jgi:hypothetical protein
MNVRVATFPHSITLPLSFFIFFPESLGVGVKLVETTVKAIANLFSEACRLALSEKDFLDSVVVLGFPAELNDELQNVNQSFFFFFFFPFPFNSYLFAPDFSSTKNQKMKSALFCKNSPLI